MGVDQHAARWTRMDLASVTVRFWASAISRTQHREAARSVALDHMTSLCYTLVSMRRSVQLVSILARVLCPLNRERVALVESNSSGNRPTRVEWVFCFLEGKQEATMIISMKLHSTKEEIAEVKARIEEFGYKVHSIEGEERVVIGAVGVGDVTACLESLEAMPQVEKAVRISAPYKFVSREFRQAKTEIKAAGVAIGGDEFVVMAGPCSVESEKQILESAEIVARAGAKLLRGGAFKPRTSPYDFQGLELEGLKLLDKARRATGLGIITEVMSDRDVDHGRRVRRHPADRRAQHAELRAAEDAGPMRHGRCC